MHIDFSPLFWFGIVVGVIGAIVGYGVIQFLIWFISHLEWA